LRKRQLDIAVISDVHLGTPECHADELLAYLSSIQPKKLILNGDIVDVRNFRENYFPPSHLNVLRKIISMAAKGAEVHYLAGSHDDLVRKFIGTGMGNIHVANKLILNLDGKRAWFFHGDVFDGSVPKAKWLAQLGSFGFSLLLILKRGYHWGSEKIGRKGRDLARKSQKTAAQTEKHISAFEATVVELALENHYDHVICGHSHRPKKEIVEHKKGTCTYLNSGDWTTHLTALEYSFKRWKLYHYRHDKLLPFYMDEELKEMDIHDIVSNLTAEAEGDTDTVQKPFAERGDTED
jgi:UDP-2,3-diacylglucosamine pyrophosphatase LpxH